jgi:hypothetical protein
MVGNTLFRTLAAGLFLATMTGCSTPSAKSVTAADAWQSDHCGVYDPEVKVFRQKEKWSQWLEAGPEHRIPERPWSADARVVVAAGSQPTPGYGIELLQLATEGDELVISVKQSSPSQGAMLAQVITTPCLVIDVSGDEWRSARVVGLPGSTLKNSR